MTPHTYLFVDGSCGSGQDFGGWAAIVVAPKQRKILYGSVWPTTISRCELLPIVEGLRWIKSNWAVKQPAYSVVVVSDSEYTVKTLCGVYPRKKNMELWTALDEAAKQLTIKYVWRERNSLPYMEFCDAICGSFRRALIHGAIERFDAKYKEPEQDMPYGMLPATIDDAVLLQQGTEQHEQDDE